jgi:hypothetical protein
MSDKFKWTESLIREWAELCRKKFDNPDWYGGWNGYERQLALFKEEKTKKDWEIVAFYDGCKNGHTDSRCVRSYHAELNEQLVLNNGYTIKSVKRISDGEVFSVGDEVESNVWGTQTIIDFNIVDGDIVVGFKSCRNPLSKIRKVVKPKPLFTTEDGVEIFDGGECWVVPDFHNDSYKWKNIINGWVGGREKYFSTEAAAGEYIRIRNEATKPKPLFMSEEGLGVFDEEQIVFYVSEFRIRERKAKNMRGINNKKFISREAAENYILINKPLLSVDDVMGIYRTNAGDMLAWLKGLAKQKLSK